MGHKHSHHHHHARPGETQELNPERYQATRRVTIAGALTNAFLALAQLLGGWLTHSAGLVADGFHTLSDLTSDFVVLFAAKKAHEEADDEHPYGHGRIETLATTMLGGLLLAVAFTVFVDVVERFLFEQPLPQPTKMALLFASLGIILKEGLYRFTIKTADKFNSDMLRANAWHHRSDALSSILVFIGVAVSLSGFVYADSIAAILVALLIGKIGFDLVYNSAQQLIDSALDEETVGKIKTASTSVDGVVDVHELRTRKSGSSAFADVRIQVSPRISISEGHQISETVRHEIMQAVPEVTDVVVHTEAEYHHEEVHGLPLRQELVERVNQLATEAGLAASIEEPTLHYLNNGVEIELRVKSSSFTSNADGLNELAEKIKTLPGVLNTSMVLLP